MSNPFILYDNRMVDGTPGSTTTSTSTEYSAANVNDYRTYTWWKGTTSTDHYIEVNAATSQNANTLGIIGHNLNTCSAAISVESSTSGAWGGEEVVRLSTFASTDDKALVKTFSSAKALHWRVRFQGCSTAPKAASIFIGARTVFPDQVISSPSGPFVPENIRVAQDSNISKAGNLLGTVVRNRTYTINPTFKALTYTWVNNTFKPFWDNHYSALRPFFWVLNSSAFPNDIKYVYAPDPRYNPTRHYSTRVETLTVPMRGVVE